MADTVITEASVTIISDSNGNIIRTIEQRPFGQSQVTNFTYQTA